MDTKDIITNKLHNRYPEVLAVAANNHFRDDILVLSKCPQAHSLARAAMAAAEEHTKALYDAGTTRTMPFRFEMTVDQLRCVFVHKPFGYTFAVVVKQGTAFAKSLQRVIRTTINVAEKAEATLTTQPDPRPTDSLVDKPSE